MKSGRNAVRRGGVALGLVLCAVLPGCAFISSPDREFRSNVDVLEGLAGAIGYSVDPSVLRLTEAEITEDAITLQYLGVDYPGDQAWVVHFAQKSTELAPTALASVETALAVIEDEGLQPSFVADSPRTVEIAGVSVECATYTFHSSLAPAGRTGRGIIAAVRREVDGLPVVVQIKLDNHGDRAVLGPADLAPLITPLRTSPARD